MDCYWCRRLGSSLYQRASLRLLIPRGDNVFPLCIKWWSSLAFLTRSRLLRISLSGIKMMSLIGCPAWLKWKETGVGSLSWRWFKMDWRCSPNRSLSWPFRFVFPMYSSGIRHLHLLHCIIVSGQRIVKYSIKTVSMTSRLLIRHSNRNRGIETRSNLSRCLFICLVPQKAVESQRTCELFEYCKKKTKTDKQTCFFSSFLTKNLSYGASLPSSSLPSLSPSSSCL